MRARHSATASAVFGLLLATDPLVAQANLLVNGGAEAGSTAGWVDASGTGFNVVSSDPRGGTFAFGGGITGSPGPWNSELRQDVSIATLAAQIDSGEMVAVLNGAGQSRFDGNFVDTARVLLECQSASGSILSVYDTEIIQPFNTWRLFSHTGFIPPGARTLRVRLLASRLAGDVTDAFFDDIHLSVLAAPDTPQSNVLFNGDAELGTPFGWADAIGHGFNVSNAIVNSGVFSFTGGLTGPAGAWSQEVYQDVGVAAWAPAIDARAIAIQLSGFVFSGEAQGHVDAGEVVLEFRTQFGVVLDSFATGVLQPYNSWHPLRHSRQMPSGTRFVRIRLKADRTAGDSTDCFFDELRLRIVPTAIPYGRETASGAGPTGPSLLCTSLPHLGATISLTIQQYDANVFPFLVGGFQRASVSLPFGTLLVGDIALIEGISPNPVGPGPINYAFAVPANDSLAGAHVNWQNANLLASGQITLSNAVETWLAR